jgi:hypothetical protein
MRKKLIWSCVALAPSCEPTLAGDNAILGKIIDATLEMKVTIRRQGAEERTAIQQITRRAHIMKDGTILMTINSGQGGEMGYVLKLNRTINLASSLEREHPELLDKISYISSPVRATFSNRLFTINANGAYIIKSDQSRCVDGTSVIVVLSPDLAGCSVKSVVQTQRCGPPNNSSWRKELIRSVSCTVKND